MRSAAYIAPIVLGLLFADHLITKGRTIGWERNCIHQARRRQQQSGRVLLLGSSTSVDWLPASYLEGLFSLPKGAVVDAHINGGHQGCTWAQVRGLLREGRRFERVFFGTNQFQLCESNHSKRVLQQRMLIPTADIGLLFQHYLRSQEPLTYLARFLGGSLSGAYADTSILQRDWAVSLFGRPRRHWNHRWYRLKAGVDRRISVCSYEPDAIAYKKGLSEALLDDLGMVGRRVYLMLLPDVQLELDDPAIRGAWSKHRRLHQALAAARPHVTLLDLAQGEGAQTRDHFRDRVHVNEWGARLQRRLFEQRLAESGELPVVSRSPSAPGSAAPQPAGHLRAGPVSQGAPGSPSAPGRAAPQPAGHR